MPAMQHLSMSARLRLTFALVFSCFAVSISCAHKAGEPAKLDEPHALVEAPPPIHDSPAVSETEAPLPLERPCAEWRQPLLRPVKIHLNVEFPDPPEEMRSLLEDDDDVKEIGARLLAETERRLGACVQPRDIEEYADDSDLLRVATKDGVFRVGLRLREPCVITELGEIAGDFCLELSPAEGGGVAYTMSIGDLMVRELRLGDVLLHLRMDQETRIPHSEIFVSMDRLPGDLAEHILAPLVPFLEAGTRAFLGLLDIGLHVLARILVDVMGAAGYRSDAHLK